MSKNLILKSLYTSVVLLSGIGFQPTLSMDEEKDNPNKRTHEKVFSDRMNEYESPSQRSRLSSDCMATGNATEGNLSSISVGQMSQGIKFQDIEDCFNKYKETKNSQSRVKIISGINSLMQTHGLPHDEKSIEILNNMLGSIDTTETFKIRVKEYLKRIAEGDGDTGLGNLNSLSAILTDIIMPTILDGAKVNHIKSMIQVSKGFSLLMLNAPVGLNFTFQKFGDKQLHKIVELFPNMKEVIFSSTDVTDAAMGALGTLKNLQILDLSYSDITNKGIVYLGTLTNLRTLDLRSTDVTDIGIAYLKNQLPNCIIRKI